MTAEPLKTAFARALLIPMNWMRRSGLLYILYRWPAARRRYLTLYSQMVFRVVKEDHPDPVVEVEIEPIDMGVLVKNVVARLEPLLADKNAELNYPEQWPTALGYAPWVEEIWVNLISNALKYGGV